MDHPTLWASAALGLVVTMLYFAVGVRKTRRAAARGDVTLGWYAIFWVGIGAHALVESLWTIAMLVVDVPLALSVAVLQVKIATAVLAFFSLVYYLLVVYTGRRGFLVPLAVVYVGILLFVNYHYAGREPVGQELRMWVAGLVYENDGAQTWPFAVGLLFGPPLAASIAYAALLRYAKDPAQRRRILFTSISFLVFFGTFILGNLNETWAWWGLCERIIAIAAVAGVLVATSDPRPSAARQAATVAWTGR